MSLSHKALMGKRFLLSVQNHTVELEFVNDRCVMYKTWTKANGHGPYFISKDCSSLTMEFTYHSLPKPGFDDPWYLPTSKRRTYAISLENEGHHLVLTHPKDPLRTAVFVLQTE